MLQIDVVIIVYTRTHAHALAQAIVSLVALLKVRTHSKCHRAWYMQTQQQNQMHASYAHACHDMHNSRGSQCSQFVANVFV